MQETNEDIILIDISSTDLTMEQVMAKMETYRQNGTYDGYDIFLDGERRAIIARPKRRFDCKEESQSGFTTHTILKFSENRIGE